MANVLTSKRLIVLFLLGVMPAAFGALPQPRVTTSTADQPDSTAVQPDSTTVQPLDTIVAVVNNDVITRNELDQAIAKLKQQLQQQNIPLPDEQRLNKQVLSRLIEEKLQLQLAKKGGIKISATELNQAIESVAKRNNVTLSEMRSQIEKQGMSYTEYRKQIRDQVTIARLQQMAVGRNITVSDQEVDNLIKQYQREKGGNKEYRVQNILIALPDVPSPKQIQTAKQQAEDLVAKLNKGADFRETAIAQSSGQQAFQGGDLGWRKSAALPTAFAQDVKSMKPGEIVGPIRTPNGFHIIKLAAVRAAKSKTMTKSQAQQILYGRKFNQALQSWLRNLRDTAYVKIE